MSFNPFDDEPQAPEATNSNAFENKETKTVVVNEANEGKYTVTLKGGTGFDSPWIVIHAADASDALTQLQDPNLKSLIDRASEVGRYFASLSGGGAAPTQRPAAQGNTGGRPAHKQAPAGETVPECAHGAMEWRSWVRKSDGKAFKGFFCTAENRDEQCKAQFRN